MKVDCLKIYQNIDYVPLLSAATNFITLLAKAILSCMPNTNSNPTSFRAYVLSKEKLRCLALIFLPVISNIFFAIHDYRVNKKFSQVNELTPYSGAKIKEVGIFEKPEYFESFIKKFPEINAQHIHGDRDGYPSRDEYPWIYPKDMSSLIMRGEKDGHKMLAFNLTIKIPEETDDLPPGLSTRDGYKLENRVFILWQRHPHDSNSWTASYPGRTLPHVPFVPGDYLFKDSHFFMPLLDLFDKGSFTYENTVFWLKGLETV